MILVGYTPEYSHLHDVYYHTNNKEDECLVNMNFGLRLNKYTLISSFYPRVCVLNKAWKRDYSCTTRCHNGIWDKFLISSTKLTLTSKSETISKLWYMSLSVRIEHHFNILVFFSPKCYPILFLCTVAIVAQLSCDPLSEWMCIGLWAHCFF